MKWEELSMHDRHQYMKMAVQNGYRDIRTIREAYNKYAMGGPEYTDEDRARVRQQANEAASWNGGDLGALIGNYYASGDKQLRKEGDRLAQTAFDTWIAMAQAVRTYGRSVARKAMERDIAEQKPLLPPQKGGGSRKPKNMPKVNPIADIMTNIRYSEGIDGLLNGGSR